jgi:hypothetical protein
MIEMLSKIVIGTVFQVQECESESKNKAPKISGGRKVL